jgi:hypothetical protein
MSRRGNGLPSASFMRSGIGIAGSCQGIVGFRGIVLRDRCTNRAVEKSCQKLRGVGSRYRRNVFRQSEQASEQAIEPSALLHRETARIQE